MEKKYKIDLGYWFTKKHALNLLSGLLGDHWKLVRRDGDWWYLIFEDKP